MNRAPRTEMAALTQTLRRELESQRLYHAVTARSEPKKVR